MKRYFYILFIFGLNLFSAHGAERECAKVEPQGTLDTRNLENVQKLLSATNLSLKEKQIAFEKLNIDQAHAFIDSLHAEDQSEITNLLTKIKKSSSPLIEVVEADGDPVLLVHGLDLEKFPSEWIKPFHKVLKKKQLSYFFKWSKFKSIEKNRDLLVIAIKSILEKHKDKNLTIIAHSAGGIVTTFAMDTLVDDPISKKINFHTVASPLFGFEAPGIAILGIPFVGKTSIQIGMGAYKKLVHKKLNNCTNWVNTSCEMDQHTCHYSGMNPQLGPVDSKESPLPCGPENIRRISDESHSSIVDRAFSEIMK